MLTKVVFIWIIFNPANNDIDVRAVPAPSMETCKLVSKSGRVESDAAKHGLEIVATRCEVVEWQK